MKKIKGLIFILCFLLVLLAYVHYEQKQLNKHHYYAVGIITEVSKPGHEQSGDYALYYKYLVKGKKYTDAVSGNLCGGLITQKIKNLLLGKSFPVAYSATNFSWNRIIIKKEDAEKIGYKYPDSLLVYDSILTCKFRADGSTPTITQ